MAHSGDLVRYDYPDKTAQATAIISSERTEAIVSFAQVQARAYTLPLPLRVTGLDHARNLSTGTGGV